MVRLLIFRVGWLMFIGMFWFFLLQMLMLLFRCRLLFIIEICCMVLMLELISVVFFIVFVIFFFLIRQVLEVEKMNLLEVIFICLLLKLGVKILQLIDLIIFCGVDWFVSIQVLVICGIGRWVYDLCWLLLVGVMFIRCVLSLFCIQFFRMLFLISMLYCFGVFLLLMVIELW